MKVFRKARERSLIVHGAVCEDQKGCQALFHLSHLIPASGDVRLVDIPQGKTEAAGGVLGPNW